MKFKYLSGRLKWIFSVWSLRSLTLIKQQPEKFRPEQDSKPALIISFLIIMSSLFLFSHKKSGYSYLWEGLFAIWRLSKQNKNRFFFRHWINWINKATIQKTSERAFLHPTALKETDSPWFNYSNYTVV